MQNLIETFCARCNKSRVAAYCEVVDDAEGFKWRIIAEAGALGRFVGEWHSDYTSFATLVAPTGEGGRMQTWIAGSSYWHGTGKTLCGFPEFTPITIGEYLGTAPKNVKREE